MKSRLLGAVCACISFFGLVSAGNADTITLTDHFHWGGNDRDLDGVFEERGVATGPTFGAFYGGIDGRGAIEFDLSAIPTGASVDSAVLNVTLVGRGFEDPFEVNAYAGNGTLYGADFSSTNLVGGPFSPMGVGVPYAIDATIFIQDSRPSYAGFTFRMLPCNDCGVQFASEEYTIRLDWRPSLVVSFTPVPIPPALYLFASGLIGMVGMARKKATLPSH